MNPKYFTDTTCDYETKAKHVSDYISWLARVERRPAVSAQAVPTPKAKPASRKSLQSKLDSL